MAKIKIFGGNKLAGSVDISGSKNSALPIILASLLIKDKCIIQNVPNITDVKAIIDILKKIGAKIKFTKEQNTLEINCLAINYFDFENVINQTRASSYFLGAFLGRFGKVTMGLPGGCDFGVRPLDQHMKGFEALGADTSMKRGKIVAKADKLIGGEIYLDTVSVGATINIILAAVCASGITTIQNAAKEPHVVDVANFLNKTGAKIIGAGTDTIEVVGTSELHGCTHSIIPDQIEAGTFMIMAVATGGKVTLNKIIPNHLTSIVAKLREVGAKIEEDTESLTIYRNSAIKKTNVKTLPHPGFPTDLQPQMLALLLSASGTSIVTEGVWDNRFSYIPELRKMGANIDVDGKMAVVTGGRDLCGAVVNATDLRAGAALMVAALSIPDLTEIHNLEYIDRGYEKIENKLELLGAKIERSETVMYAV